MHLFTTILFVDGNPVKYDVRSEADRLLLLPIDNPNNYLVPPFLYAEADKNGWRISGTQDRDLMDQVIEDICLHAAQLPVALSKLCGA